MDTQITSMKIELITSSIKKAQLKAFVYGLFVEFEIDEDFDLLSIEYHSSQKQNRMDYYDQCLIIFRKEAGNF